jgi:hypothetical protein
MVRITRKFLSLTAAYGPIASALVYIGSYSGLTMDRIASLAIGLHVGIFVLLIPMYAVEYSTVNDRTFFRKGFARGMSKWLLRGIQLLGLFFAVHLVLFLVQSHGAAPKSKTGNSCSTITGTS